MSATSTTSHPSHRTGARSPEARRTSPPPASAAGDSPPGPFSPDSFGADIIVLADPSRRRIRVRRAAHHWLELAGSDADGTATGGLRGLLGDTVPVADPPGPVREVVLVGDGPAAESIGRALIGGPGVRLVLGRDPSHPAERPAEWQTSLLAERRSGIGPARWSDTQPDDAWRPGAVVVVATATVEPDRVLVQRLVRRGADHVIVRAHHGVALVGPWVRPGVSPCLGCHDHWLAAHDPGYAAVLNELEQRPAVTDASTIGWVAATLGRQFASPDAGRRGLAGHIEVSDPIFPTLRGLEVAPHPSCRCGAG